MSIDLPTPETLERKSEKKRTSLLFGVKQSLLRYASFEGGREEIFATRAKIAEVFMQYGGERLQNFVELLESLKCPEDLEPHSLKPRQKQEIQKPEIEWTGKGYYVIGDPIQGERYRQMQQKLGGKKRAGTSIEIKDLNRLFQRKERTLSGEMGFWDDDRPYFINAEMTPELVQLLSFVLISRPDMKLYVIEWDGDKPKFKELQSDQLIKAQEQLDPALVEASNQLYKLNNISPITGETYVGKIRRVCEFGFFVEITPNYEGLVHISEASDVRINEALMREMFKEGEFINVQILQIDRQGRIRLSVRAAESSNNKPVIDEKLSFAILSNDGATDMKELIGTIIDEPRESDVIDVEYHQDQ